MKYIIMIALAFLLVGCTQTNEDNDTYNIIADGNSTVIIDDGSDGILVNKDENLTKTTVKEEEIITSAINTIIEKTVVAVTKEDENRTIPAITTEEPKEIILYDFNLSKYLRPDNNISINFDEFIWNYKTQINDDLRTNVGTLVIKESNTTLLFDVPITDAIKRVIDSNLTGSNKFDKIYTNGNDSCFAKKEAEVLHLGSYSYYFLLQVICNIDRKLWYLYFKDNRGLIAFKNNDTNKWYTKVKE